MCQIHRHRYPVRTITDDGATQTEYDGGQNMAAAELDIVHTLVASCMAKKTENEGENREILLIKVQITVWGNVHCHKRELHNS